MGEKKDCAVDKCTTPARARGWCSRHYKRWKAYGDPTYAKFESVRGATDEERFWAKVEPTGFCWNWTAAREYSGHGMFNLGAEYDRRPVRAHRFAYETLVGLIPEGLELDHLCRNRACVNPDHLEPVTHEENMRRGFAPSQALNRRGVCAQGHDTRNDENVFIAKSGRRTCKICAARRQREYLDRKKAAAREAT
jgi:hypothetical protein